MSAASRGTKSLPSNAYTAWKHKGDCSTGPLPKFTPRHGHHSRQHSVPSDNIAFKCKCFHSPLYCSLRRQGLCGGHHRFGLRYWRALHMCCTTVQELGSKAGDCMSPSVVNAGPWTSLQSTPCTTAVMHAPTSKHPCAGSARFSAVNAHNWRSANQKIGSRRFDNGCLCSGSQYMPQCVACSAFDLATEAPTTVCTGLKMRSLLLSMEAVASVSTLRSCGQLCMCTG